MCGCNLVCEEETVDCVMVVGGGRGDRMRTLCYHESVCFAFKKTLPFTCSFEDGKGMCVLHVPGLMCVLHFDVCVCVRLYLCVLGKIWVVMRVYYHWIEDQSRDCAINLCENYLFIWFVLYTWLYEWSLGSGSSSSSVE